MSFLVLLLFIPKFSAQQFGRVVRDLSQPLLKGLALFGVKAAVAWPLRRMSGFIILVAAVPLLRLLCP